jgi:glycosyltransferase involved in cell wall biosynthesis
LHKNPLVSICCISFNHEKFIKQCLEGFAIQQTNFDFEILIFDDASEDSTQKIIREFADENINVRLFLQSENQWSKGKYGLIDWLFPASKGKYIAICEGDDYWIDDTKLQKQVDILECDPSLSGCFCNSIYVDEKGIQIGQCERVPIGMDIILFEDIAQRFMFHTPSLVFRNMDSLQVELTRIVESMVGDLPLTLLLLTKGNFKFLNQNMVAYRMNVGVSNDWNRVKAFEQKINVLEKISLELDLTNNQKYALKVASGFLNLKIANHLASQQNGKGFISNYVDFISKRLYSFKLKTKIIETIRLKQCLQPFVVYFKSMFTTQKFQTN